MERANEKYRSTLGSALFGYEPSMLGGELECWGERCLGTLKITEDLYTSRQNVSDSSRAKSMILNLIYVIPVPSQCALLGRGTAEAV